MKPPATIDTTLLKLRSKFFACVLGMFAGMSVVVAQIPGPVNLWGSGGNTIAEAQVPQYGTGGTFQTIANTGVGGTISTNGAYTYHAFTTPGSFSFAPPVGVTTIDVLIVGGGGGGGGYRRGGGGGGGGGVRSANAQAVTLPVYTVTVGAGGAGGTSANTAVAGNGQPGGRSVFGALQANGGGGGLRGDQPTENAPTVPTPDGGSGGGGGSTSQNNETRFGATGGTYGNNGGNGATSNATNDQRGGGGGGAAAAGGNGGAGGGSAGAGGAGADVSATWGTGFGDNGRFGGGGGGGKRNATGGSAGAGGVGGGGAGGTAGNGTAGTAATGGGGGGGGNDAAANGGAAGGSGVVLVRYLTPAAQTIGVHTYSAVGNFDFVPPAGGVNVQVLMVAGGGGGGGDQYGAGGGGAGGVVLRNSFAVAGTVGVTVGGPGTAGAANGGFGGNGGNSVFSTLTALGGGGGQPGNRTVAGSGLSGGSGGGGGSKDSNGNTQTGGAGTQPGSASGGFGNNGANGGAASTTDNNNMGGGGGGAGGLGDSGVIGVAATSRGGNGGVGLNLSAVTGAGLGASGWFGGGGGGGKRTGGTGGVGGTSGGFGGTGGGGAGGSNTSAAGVAATVNSGGGGGGSGSANDTAGGAGGSGMIIVRYIPPTATYVVHTFTSSGTFTPPPGVTALEVLVVGGGGGGGSRHGGGGGGGGVVFHSAFPVVAPSYNVVVGAGGGPTETAPTSGSVGANGQNSSFDNIIALGGGGGGSYTAAVPTGGGSGGGGGGAGDNANRTAGIANQGNSGGGTGYGSNGGNGAGPGTVADMTGGGGGGGANGVGALAVGQLGGAGGSGRLFNMNGIDTWYAGGGGGGSGGVVANIAAGGQGGGGNGGSLGAPGSNGTANTGGGGGGSRSDVPGGTTASRGGTGGSGVVIVRYRPATLTITTQASATADSGLVFAQQPQVRLLNSAGNAVPGINVTAAVESGTATLSGTATVATNGSGFAVFSNLVLTGTAGLNTLNFTAAGSSNEVVTNNINLLTYHFEITHASSYALCAAFVPITIAVRKSNGDPVPNFDGVMTLTSSGGHGNYAPGIGAAPARFNNGTPNNGSATYDFDPADNGQVILNYSTLTPGTITFNATSGSIPTQNYALSLSVAACKVQIAYVGGGSGDVCTPKGVTFSVVDAANNVVTSYLGTINLSTSTANGSWFDPPAAQGVLNNLGSGNASYTFVGGDAGVVTLELTHPVIAPSVNINVNAGSFVEDPAADPSLAVVGCTFRVSYSSPSLTSCTSTTVTLDVYNSGGLLATAYAGNVSLSTSTAHGTWVSSTGGGTLLDPSPNNGTGTYNFVAGDGGSVDFVFSNLTVETLNIIATANSGGISVDPAFNPPLNVTSCVPSVQQSICYANQSQASAISVLSSAATSGSRMVLMYIGSQTETAATGATLNGQAMTFLRRETNTNGAGAIGATVEVWYMLDANLPTATAATYNAAFTGIYGTAPAMCLVSLNNVKQVAPVAALLPANGPLNSSQAVDTEVAATTITTIENNSMMLSAVITGEFGTTYTSSLGNVLWASGPPNPVDSVFAGNWAIQPAPQQITVTEDNSDPTPNRHAHLVLALPPNIAGPAIADGYVPVTLFKTFSGNVNYRTIGNTLRSDPNGPNSCAMLLPLGTGSTATLTLPPGSTILDAYLYWAGSGFEGDADNVVRFGVDGGPRDEITADETFIIEQNLVLNPAFGPLPVAFFAGYKNITGIISASPSTTYRFSDLSVRIDLNWASLSACLSGWALVVVYENPGENLNVINLFHGFQPFWHSSFTLVPRNFRMATPNSTLGIPNGQITHITFEGDPDITGANEEFELQNNPADPNAYSTLTNTPNPADNQYNSTVTFPNYTGFTFNNSYSSNAASYGVDIDTYYIRGDTNGQLLYPFGVAEAEQINTRYGTSQDAVLLVGEFISVTNAPIADMEVFLSGSGPFKVNTVAGSSYVYEVINNGNGAVTGGFADGDVILTGNLPNGITINTITADGWNCTVATASAFTCVFEIATQYTLARGATTLGQLKAGETLPDVTVTVNIGDETAFPLLNNDVTTVARLAHVGDYTTCGALVAGVQPDPTVCTRAPQFDNINDLNKYLIDIDDIDDKQPNNNNVDSDTRNVRGIETNLGITKAVVGVLESNEPAQYQLTITNFGPDATTKTMTVVDTVPNGLAPLTAVGTNWSCGIAVQTVTCTRSVALGVSASTTILITTADIVAPAIEGSFVTNSATVTPGNFNFDTVPANNSATDLTQVTGPLAAGTEKYLLSVSADGTSIGGLGPFGDGDLVSYDPVSNTATMFLLESSIPGTTSLGDINALHVLPNGHILLSTATPGSTINNLAFGPEDLVLYDPILQTATLVFDGSSIFTGGADIDAVHVNLNGSYLPADWDIILSTAATATIGALTFQDNDLVIYDMSTALATLLEDGADDDMFDGATGDISALYIRYDDADRYVVSTSDLTATIGISGSEQVSYERGELVEIDLSTPNDPTTEPLFCDNVLPCEGSPPGIFTPVSNTRRLDAVHVVESGYFGHFAISSAGGDTCSATAINITKHAGLTHAAETWYRGSIIVSNNLGEGIWAKDVTANGTLTDLGGGSARYTFAPGDNGHVILFITDTSETANFNVNVRTNQNAYTTITTENAPTEDPNIVINDLVTVITYADQFTNATYSNNDGVASFGSSWSESGDDNNATGGKIRITGGELRFNNLGGGTPALQRTIDFSSYTVDQPPVLSFNWRIAGSPTGSFEVQARGNDAAAWTTLQTFSAASGSGSAQYSFTQAPWNLVLSATTQIRFRLATGYSANANEYFYIDNAQVSTQTNDCGVGDTVDHYAISHSGNMVSCVMELVTITPHTVADLETQPGLGTVLTLNTSTGKGTWGAPISGTGPFSAVAGTGQATYTYQLGEGALVFPFNYTDLATDPEVLTITVQDNNVPAKLQLENQTLSASRAGLRFFNDSDSNEIFPTLVAGMPSNLFPADVLTVQAVQSSDNDPTVCEAIFAPGEDVTLELAFECIDPLNCSGATIPVNVTNNNNTFQVEPVNNNSGSWVNTGGFTPVTLRFNTFTGGDVVGTYSGAALVLNYADAGSMQIHGRYDIALRNDTGPNSGDYMEGSGANNFVVRPFGYDIDFNQDRFNNGNDNDAASWAADANGSAFFTAGAGFNTTVRAIAWQAADDANNDGVPDAGADLFNNNPTPNYGNETVPAQNDMTVTRTLVQPVGGVPGTLSNGTFTNFGANNGTETHTMTYSEVGIIDLTATLDSGNYLGGGQGITSTVNNVGRFIPADFLVDTTMLTARPLFTPSASPFTYMGEEFTARFDLTARNFSGVQTQNYYGSFAKLDTLAELNFFAVKDIAGGNDINYSARLSKVVGGTNPFPATFGGDWTAGNIMLEGNLVFSRQVGNAPEAPITELQIALQAQDNDSVIDAGRNVDVDIFPDEDINDIYNLIGTREFRYGRLRLDNAYGSEIPDVNDALVAIGRDVGVNVIAEYYDGTNFIVNTDDVATAYSSAELDFVPGSYVPEEVTGTNQAVVTSGISGVVSAGATIDGDPDHTLLYLRAPGAGNQGTVIIELDLDALGLGFLKYDWRTTNDLEDETPDGNYSDNPRSFVEFGAFRGNDRVINWLELFLN